MLLTAPQNNRRNLLLVNSNADHLDVGDFGLSKLLKVKQAHDLYKMTSETGSYRYMAPEVFKHRKVSQTFYCRPHFCNKKLKIPLVNSLVNICCWKYCANPFSKSNPLYH
ncbi:unnamed protein product [Amaranthus hypochondriacus]